MYAKLLTIVLYPDYKRKFLERIKRWIPQQEKKKEQVWAIHTRSSKHKKYTRLWQYIKGLTTKCKVQTEKREPLHNVKTSE